jgi:hypothetical protein
MKNTKGKKNTQDTNFKKFMLATVPQIYAALCSRGDYTLTEHHSQFLETSAIESATRIWNTLNNDNKETPNAP